METMCIYQVAHVLTLLLMTVVNITSGQDSCSGSAIYTRWGRQGCPDDAELIYSGFVGGSLFNGEGGGSNHLCLRYDPVFGPNNETRGNRRASIYGAEYQDPPRNSELNNHEVPCAVCLVPRRLVLMVPGTNLCDEGWTTEYIGYIASARSYDNRQRTEFECMDADAQATNDSNPELGNGIRFFPTQAVCGTLPCLPYVEDKDLLCAVCSRC